MWFSTHRPKTKSNFNGANVAIHCACKNAMCRNKVNSSAVNSTAALRQRPLRVFAAQKLITFHISLFRMHVLSFAFYIVLHQMHTPVICGSCGPFMLAQPNVLCFLSALFLGTKHNNNHRFSAKTNEHSIFNSTESARLSLPFPKINLHLSFQPIFGVEWNMSVFGFGWPVRNRSAQREIRN